MAESGGVKAAGRTIDLFEALVDACGPLTLTDLARRLDIPMSSCHALVRTLQSRGYLYILDERKRIYPTKRLGELAATIAKFDPVLERLGPILKNLATVTGETSIIGKHQGDHVVYLDVQEGTHTVRFRAAAGDVRPSHSSAVGKSTLSLLDDDELTRVIRRLKRSKVTEKTITDPAALRADIIASRKRGYFISRGETVIDVMGVSIAQKIGGELYAIGVAGPFPRVEANLEKYVKALRAAARVIAGADQMVL
jgi:Transcriptional regulator